MTRIAATTIALVLSLLAGCSDPGPAPKGPFENAVKVRAFLYKPDPSEIMSGFAALNPTAVPRDGITLSPGQLEDLRRALLPPTSERTAVAACFEPRHGFVFEDAQGRVIGTLDVCFECANYRYDAPGLFDQTKPISDRYDEATKGKPYDEKSYSAMQKEIDAVRTAHGIPPISHRLDWSALSRFVNSLGMPADPAPADYERLANTPPAAN
jgi:hypothetical protein